MREPLLTGRVCEGANIDIVESRVVVGVRMVVVGVATEELPLRETV